MAPTLVLQNTTVSAIINPDYTHWMRQDQLIVLAIVSSVADTVTNMLGGVKTSKDAWQTLKTMFANSSRSRILSLKEKLSHLSKGDLSITAYMQQIKTLSDELAIIHQPLDNTDLVLYTLNGIGAEFREVAAAIRARDTPISFEELHEKLEDFETYIKRSAQSIDNVIPTAHAAQRYRPSYTNTKDPHWTPSSKSQSGPHSSKRVICKYCHKPGHTEKVCYKLHGYPNRTINNATHPPAAMYAQNTSTYSSPKWIMDSGATHHVTNDLQNLSFNTPYTGSDQLLVGDGSGLNISHTGTSFIHSPSSHFQLADILCVPSIKQNLLSVSKLCKTNCVSVEFFPKHFLVKDLKTGTVLMQGHHHNNLYTCSLPPSSKASLASIQFQGNTVHTSFSRP